MPSTLPLLSEEELFSSLDRHASSLTDPGKSGHEGGPGSADNGFGALSTARGPLPLAALEVHARLDGLVAAVEVSQTFINTHPEPLEATYLFPLPDRAAVTRFRLEVAGRVVEGELQERQKARQEYDQAIRTGHRAALAEEERAGVFTMRVGNLPPGERAVVRLTLVGPLPHADDEVTFRFPLVVAPRYIPGSPAPASSDAGHANPPVLLPGFPNPVQLRIQIDVPSSPLAPHDFRSSLHAVVESHSDSGRTILLQPGERLDRDFILRYRLGVDRVHTGLVVRPDAGKNEGTFLLTVVPPRPRKDQPARPRDVVFVLDRSGSMSGWKMVAARRAVARLVETLSERDRFTVYAFDDSIDTPPGFDGSLLVPASDRQRFRAVEFLAGIEARGGTEMAEPLQQAASELSRSPTGSDRVLVLITDGQVGNEDQILRDLAGRLQRTRIFTLGIDRAVNAAFLRRLADLGGGISQVVESEQRLDEVMDQMHRQIADPVLVNLEVRPAGLEVIESTVVPARLPDLFAGTPLLIAGRYRGDGTGALALRGRDARGESWSTEVSAWLDAESAADRIWARSRVRDLEDRHAIGGDRAKLEQEIVETSLKFGVLSRFTAFVAVDRCSVVNPGGEVEQITQAVEQPSGWGQPAPQAASMPAAAVVQASLSSRTFGFAAPAPSPAPSPARRARAGAESPPLRGIGPRKLREITPEDLELLRSAAPETPPESPGLVQRLLSLFGLGRPAGSAQTISRAAFRPRVEDLLKRLQGGSGDAAGRLDALRKLVADLETLFSDLVAAGERHESVERLGKELVALRPLLTEPFPTASAVTQVYDGLLAALRDWLAVAPAG